jgi:hypothetical protein
MALAVAACGGGKMATEDELMNTEERRKARVGKLFGEDSFVFGPGDRKAEECR